MNIFKWIVDRLISQNISHEEQVKNFSDFLNKLNKSEKKVLILDMMVFMNQNQDQNKIVKQSMTEIKNILGLTETFIDKGHLSKDIEITKSNISLNKKHDEILDRYNMGKITKDKMMSLLK